MASTKGSCSGTAGSKYNFYIDYTSQPPDIENNRTYVTVKTTLQRNDGSSGSAYNNDPVNRVIINVAGGGEEVNTLRGIDTRNNALVTLATWSGWLNHNADGTLTVSLAGSFTMSGLSTLTGGSVSASWTLPTIPRKSTITFSSPATMNSSMNFTISRAASFTHTLRYAFGSTSGTIVDKVSTYPTISWTPPLSLANQVPDATSGVGTIYLDTYNGSTLIGTNSYSITLNVPSSVVPSPGSINFTRINGNVPDEWNLYVQGQSKVTVSSSDASGAYGSSISSYTISGGGYYGSSSSLTTGFLNTAGTNTFTITVRDSRGRTNSVLGSITVISWSVPAISSLLVERCDSNGAYNGEGLYFKVYCAYSFASVAGKNSASAKISYEINGSGSPIQSNISIGNGIDSVLGPISTDYSYKITVTISDQFSTISVPKTIPTAAVILDFKANGRGVAVGKVSELDDTFECGWTSKFNKSLKGTTIIASTNYIAARKVYDVTPPSGTSIDFEISEPNYDTILQFHRVTIKPTQDATVTGWFGMGFNSTSKYALIKSNIPNDYVKFLEKDVTYEFALVSVGGSWRWQCLNYNDDLSPNSKLKTPIVRQLIWPILGYNTNYGQTYNRSGLTKITDSILYSPLVFDKMNHTISPPGFTRKYKFACLHSNDTSGGYGLELQFTFSGGGQNMIHFAQFDSIWGGSTIPRWMEANNFFDKGNVPDNPNTHLNAIHAIDRGTSGTGTGKIYQIDLMFYDVPL